MSRTSPSEGYVDNDDEHENGDEHYDDETNNWNHRNRNYDNVEFWYYNDNDFAAQIYCDIMVILYHFKSDFTPQVCPSDIHFY